MFGPGAPNPETLNSVNRVLQALEHQVLGGETFRGCRAIYEGHIRLCWNVDVG